MVEKFVGLDNSQVFEDAVGQAIKRRLLNFAVTKYNNPDPEVMEAAVNRTKNVVAITREAILEALKAESELLIFKQTFNEPIPTLFISGVLHSIDVIQGEGIVTN